LYVCATPIGNLEDVGLRTLDVLRRVELIAAEDTRRSRKLLSRFDIHTPLTSLFAHNEAQKTAYVLGLLRAQKDVALVTDAGTPGISDPGSRLVRATIAEGLPLTVVPGPSAPVTAVVASGLAGDAGFRFVGYLPRRAKDLRGAWATWRRCGGVVVAFETPQRLIRSLTELAILGPTVPAAVCRELTKIHEEVVRGHFVDLIAHFVPPADSDRPGIIPRGEITLVMDLGAAEADTVSAADACGTAAALLAKGLSRRDAALALQICLGLPHRRADALVRDAARGG
jgi:16S rRNA (cytidine1402-2'-O)-methyltransferase